MNISKSTQIGAATAAVALAAAGAAVAASKLHHSRNGLQTGIAYGSPVSSGGTTTTRAPQGAPPFRGDRRGGPGGRGDDLATITSYLGITADTLQTALSSGKTLGQVADATSGKSAAGLIDALVKAEQAELDAAVKAGTLTQAQADQASANLKTRVTAQVNDTFRGGPGTGHDRGGPGGHFDHGGGLTAATTYLGITADALQTALSSGKTLAQVADATPGKSAAGLIDALVKSEQAELDAAVKAGQLTQAQADQAASNLKARITAGVDGTFQGRGPDGDHGGPPPGAPGSPAPSTGTAPGGVHI